MSDERSASKPDAANRVSDVFGHPWLGGYFDDPEMAKIWSPESDLTHMLCFEAAYTRALGACGVVPAAMAEDAATLIAEIDLDWNDLQKGCTSDGLPVPALVRQLRKRVGESLAKAVHYGSTSQDVMDTALALTLRETTNLIDQRLARLGDALSALDAQFGAKGMMGRTRMQAALAITVSDRVATWRLPLAEHRMRFEALRPQVERLQFGGPVGTRAELGEASDAVVSHLAASLNLGNPAKAWHAMRQSIVDYANALSLVTGSLGKIGADLCLMSQQGIDEATFKGGGGSSAMPHKQNPVLAELLVTLARFNATQVSGVHHALVHEQERSGSAWTLEMMLLPQMAMATGRALSAAEVLLQSISRIGSAETN